MTIYHSLFLNNVRALKLRLYKVKRFDARDSAAVFGCFLR